MAAASRPTTTQPDHSYCEARTRGGKPCRRPAGWGTEHVGWGQCKLHGGCTPNGIIAAAREQAAALTAAAAELEPDIEPHEVLLGMVRRAYGLVHLYGRKYRELLDQGDDGVQEHPLLVQDVTETAWESTGDRGRGAETKTSNQVTVHAWGRLYHEAIDRAAKLAKLALDAGVDERRVALAEQRGEEVVDLLRAVIDGLGLTAEQLERAPQVVEGAMRRFEVIEGGLAA